MEASPSDDKSRRSSGSTLFRLMAALVAALATPAAGTAFAAQEPVPPTAQGSENCRNVQERLRAHGSGGQTTLCAETATSLSWTDSRAPRANSDVTGSGRVSARGLRPDPTPRAVPRYCPTRLGVQLTDGRFDSCAKGLFRVTDFNSRGGVIGRATFAATEWARLSPRARSWVYNLKLNAFRGTGTLVRGLYLAASGRCVGGCRISAARPPDGRRAWIGPGARLQGSWTMVSPGRRTLSHRFTAVLTGYLAGAVFYEVAVSYLGRARCDSAAYLQSSGCVYPANPGLFPLSAAPGSGVTQAARFYRDAQQSLGNHAGRLDGSPLRRTRNEATRRANQAAARRRCATLFGPRPPDQQCDEYPFASARARTSAFRVRFVPGEQNEEAGRRLNGFYRSSRILDGDPFYVRIVG